MFLMKLSPHLANCFVYWRRLHTKVSKAVDGLEMRWNIRGHKVFFVHTDHDIPKLAIFRNVQPM
jgi:hypothetical protein